MAGRNVQLSLDGSNAGSSINDWDVTGGGVLAHHEVLNTTHPSYYLEADNVNATNTFTVSSPGSFVVGEVVKFLSIFFRYGSNVTTNNGEFIYQLLDGGNSDAVLYNTSEEWVAPPNAGKTNATSNRNFVQHSSGTPWDATNLGNLKVLVTPITISADKLEIHNISMKIHIQGPHTGGYQGPNIQFSRLEGDGHNVKILEGKTELVAGKTMITDTDS